MRGDALVLGITGALAIASRLSRGSRSAVPSRDIQVVADRAVRAYSDALLMAMRRAGELEPGDEIDDYGDTLDVEEVIRWFGGYEQMWGMHLGAGVEIVGVGTARIVLGVDDLVIKIPIGLHPDDVIEQEVSCWRDYIRGTNAEAYVLPMVGSGYTSDVAWAAFPRVEVLSDDINSGLPRAYHASRDVAVRSLEKLGFAPDDHDGNFGWWQGRWVLLDYQDC